MLFFFRFWYVQSFAWAWQHYRSTIASFEAQIAIKATWKNIGEPLFQDYTFQGKVIGFFLRIARIFFGGIFYGIIACIALFLYIFWLLFPILCLISILGYFSGSPSIPSLIASPTTTFQ